MEKYKIMHEDIKNIESAEISKQNHISVIGTLLILTGIALGFWGMCYTDPNSAFPSFLFTISTLAIIGGIIKLCLNFTIYIYKPTKSILKLKTLYFPASTSDELQNCLTMNRFDELENLKQEKNSNLKLEAMVSKDNQFVAAQVLEYVPYSFEAISPVICFYGENASKLTKALKIHKI